MSSNPCIVHVIFQELGLSLLIIDGSISAAHTFSAQCRSLASNDVSARFLVGETFIRGNFATIQLDALPGSSSFRASKITTLTIVT